MSAKHTPGPWWVGGVDSDEVHCRIFARDMGCNAYIRLVDAPSVGDLIPDEQLKANARLIAAAPKLLEALKRFLDAWEFDSDGNGAAEQARAAITEAIG